MKHQRYWTESEHELFLKGLGKYGQGKWKEISGMIPTKDAGQVRSHAQKYHLALEKGSTLGANQAAHRGSSKGQPNGRRSTIMNA